MEVGRRYSQSIIIDNMSNEYTSNNNDPQNRIFRSVSQSTKIPDHPHLKAASLPRAKHQQGFAKKLRRPKTAGTDVTSTSSTFNQLYKPVIEVTQKDYSLRLSGYVEKTFHTSVLHTRMHSFQFSHDPIDLLIRKLLMMVDLPVETQQIDRLIESFSKRYVECNPKLFNNSGMCFSFFL
ncbi:hypothetical protein PSTT_00521 [Puccinia striiformis]|uniref:SEC7 domain-containing protein n=1 Tax=Puccinia striiformis TaxID=27350 RepID=A0A2S4W726_9BASI|nr:hypothetical protein PSTT_00521 [Puccinia striiformis]